MPAGTPPDIVHKVNAEIMKALQSEDVLAKYRSMGVDTVKPHPPEAFGKMLAGEIARWGKVIREANVKVQ